MCKSAKNFEKLKLLDNKISNNEAEIYLKYDMFHYAFLESPIPMALVGLDGSWLTVNKKLISFLGFSENELLSKTFQDVTHTDDLNLDLDLLNELKCGRINTYSMHKRYIAKNESTKHLKLTVVAVKNNNNNIMFYISQILPIQEKDFVFGYNTKE